MQQFDTSVILRHYASLAIRYKKDHRDDPSRAAGDALLTEMLLRLAAAGAEEVRLTVNSKNSAAKALYKKHGFERSYTLINYVAEFHPILQNKKPLPGLSCQRVVRTNSG